MYHVKRVGTRVRFPSRARLPAPPELLPLAEEAESSSRGAAESSWPPLAAGARILGCACWWVMGTSGGPCSGYPQLPAVQWPVEQGVPSGTFDHMVVLVAGLHC